MKRASPRSSRLSSIALVVLYGYLFTQIGLIQLILPVQAVAPGIPVCNGQNATIYVNESNIIVGGPGNGSTYAGTLTGTPGKDVMIGTNGNDIIKSLQNDDTICALAGVDIINSGASNDWVDGGEDENNITTEGGKDTIYSGSANDTINSGGDDDKIFSGDGDDTINSGTGEDEITSGAGNDTINGAGNQPNKVWAGEGDDMIVTGNQADEIDAGGGNDVVDAGNGRNDVIGGEGDDILVSGSGNDSLDGGNGFDRCNADGGTNLVINCETDDITPPPPASSSSSVPASSSSSAPSSSSSSEASSESSSSAASSESSSSVASSESGSSSSVTSSSSSSSSAEYGVLLVKKFVVNDGGGTKVPSDFTLVTFVQGTLFNTSTFAGSEAGYPVHLIGSYNVAEYTVPGYTPGYDAGCTGTLAAGESNVCIVTNTFSAVPTGSSSSSSSVSSSSSSSATTGQLLVRTHVINDNGGTNAASDFQLSVAFQTFAGSEDGFLAAVTGNYTTAVTISLHPAYAPFFSPDCSGTIAVGEFKECLLTLDDRPQGVVRVINQVIGGPLAANAFQMSMAGINPTFNPATPGSSPLPFPASAFGRTIYLDAGAYAVSQGAYPDYVTSYSADCTGTIGQSQLKFCTVTNTFVGTSGSSSSSSSSFSSSSSSSSGTDGGDTGGDQSFPSSSSSSSSAGGSGGEAGIFAQSDPTNGDSDQGSHLGKRTNMWTGIAQFLAGVNSLISGVAPAGFGGGDPALSTQEQEYICSMQRGLPLNPSSDLLDRISILMSGYIARTPAFIRTQLTSSLCDSINAARLPSKTTVTRVDTLFPVDSAGYPIAHNNPLWNKCVRGEHITLADVRSNADRDAYGRGYSCDHYTKAQNVWTHPELGIDFTLTATRTGAPLLSIPAGYALLKIVKVAGK